MDRASPSTGFANTLHCALELSKKSWLLAIQFPDREQPSLYPIEGGDAEKLMAKLAAARDCWANVRQLWGVDAVGGPCTCVWTGRAVQAGCGDLEIIGLAHLYSAH